MASRLKCFLKALKTHDKYLSIFEVLNTLTTGLQPPDNHQL